MRSCGWLLMALVAMALLGCGKEKVTTTIDNKKPDDPLYQVQGDDTEMEAAYAQAQKELPAFIEKFKHPGKNMSQFMIKKRFETDEHNGTETMWLEVQKFESDVFTGTLLNDPYNVRSVHAGDTLQVKQDEVIDWAYYEGSQNIGGRTDKILQAREAKK